MIFIKFNDIGFPCFAHVKREKEIHAFLLSSTSCFTHLNFNGARVRNNTKGVAGPQSETAGLAEHIILTP